MVLDLLAEYQAPFNPHAVTEQIAALLKQYRCTAVVGDRYAARWVTDAFAKVGITYRKSEAERSMIYLDVLPLFTSGRARLIDSPRLVAQFCGLERRTFPTGRDRIDHGRSGRDDACNAAAGALVLAARTVAQKIPFVAIPDLSRSGVVYGASSASGIPAHYLAQPKPLVSGSGVTGSWGAPSTHWDRWSNRNY